MLLMIAQAMLEPQSFTISSKGSITSKAFGRQYTDMSEPIKNKSDHEFTKLRLH